MRTPSPHSPDLQPVHDADALLVELRELQKRGASWQPLRGKILALMCPSEDTADAQRFRRAAMGLGAHVAWMRPSLSVANTPELIQATSRVLGKLYDAIECQDLDQGLIELISGGATVPVFNSLSALSAPSASQLQLLGENEASEASRHLLLQARLLNALS